MAKKDKKNNKYKVSKLLKFIWRYIKQYKGVVYTICILIAVENLVDVISPYIFGQIVDNFLGKEMVFGLSFAQIIIIWIILVVIRIIFSRITTRLVVSLENNASKNVMVDLVSKLFAVPISYHHDQKPGEVYKKVDRASRAVENVVNSMSFNFIPSILTIIFALVMMVTISWQLALINLIAIIAFSLFAAKFKMKQILQNRKKVNRKYNVIHGNIGDFLANIFLVKSNTTEKYELKKLNKDYNKAIKLVDDQMDLWTQVSLGQGIISRTGQVTTVVVASYFMMQQVITPGDFVVFIGYLTMIYQPLWWMTNLYRQLKRFIIDVNEAQGVLDSIEEEDFPKAKNVEINGGLEFKNLTFEYPQREEDILQDISFKVEAGETLAIFGETGSGKTTIYNLILRLYKPQKGSILYDGLNSKKIKINSLRSQIAVVPQDPVLFNESILDNIRYSRPEATNKEIIHAALVANAHEFISNLPKGYKTKVGERGVKLSGGQVQRIAIARAILRDPKILILDEATSSLDQKTKFEVLGALQKLIEGRTTIIITHDFSAITTSADKIIVLENGTVIQEGSHKKLLSEEGVYKNLYQTQQEHLKI